MTNPAVTHPTVTGPAGAKSSATRTQTALLVGTEATCRQMVGQLALLPDDVRPAPIGCILIDHRGEATWPVLGGLDDLAAAHAIHRFSMALVSIPAGERTALLQARARLRSLGVVVRLMPPLEELMSPAGGDAMGPASFGAAPDPVELIGRTPYGIDRRAVARVLEGKRVLITGAGGSIGSELARIAATFNPERLILMERAENALFEIDRQIGSRHPEISRAAVLHDVVDAEQTLRQLVALRPQVVFHAAAHKHVPLMEDHPSHAVTNNVFGTKSIADAAVAVGAERFVMISSDKAVNPTSIMGATKRLAEMYIQALHGQSVARGGAGGGTRFSMVRFGNVLGSACSVLPIWSSQLAEGAPITVTDPRMTRYFMTIHEAASLVIQSAAIDPDAANACVFVLDMGDPVRIYDLARRYVLAHGFDVQVVKDGVVIEEASGAGSLRNEARPVATIRITGARPGEKLHEELAYAAEMLRPTPFPGISAWAGSLSSEFNLAAMVSELSAVRGMHDRAGVVSVLQRWVPELTRGKAASVPSDDAEPSFHRTNTDHCTNTTASAA